MKILFQKRPEGLFPLYPVDKDKLFDITNGELVQQDIKKLRNPDYHRLVFRFLNVVYAYQDEFDSFELFRKRVKWYSGCYSEYMIDDKMITELDSWDFENCDQYEFQDIFKRVKTACWAKFVPNFKQSDIRQAEIELSQYD